MDKVDQGCLENIVIMALEEWPGPPQKYSLSFPIWIKYVKFSLNCLNGAGMKNFQISPMYFHNFFYPLLLWTLALQESFVSSLVQIDPVILNKNWRMWKVYNHYDIQANGQTTGDNKSSLVIQGS